MALDHQVASKCCPNPNPSALEHRCQEGRDLYPDMSGGETETEVEEEEPRAARARCQSDSRLEAPGRWGFESSSKMVLSGQMIRRNHEASFPEQL